MPNYISDGLRVLFIHELGWYATKCNHCPVYYNVVSDINMRLPPRKEIKIVEANSNHSLAERIDPEGTPYLYIDGMVKMGALKEAGVRGWLKGLLEDEFIT